MPSLVLHIYVSSSQKCFIPFYLRKQKDSFRCYLLMENFKRVVHVVEDHQQGLAKTVGR